MKKLVTLILIILLATFVYAAGSTAGAVQKIDKDGNAVINCEGFSAPRNRIKCRLENDMDAQGNPEPCRALTTTKAASCSKLYADGLPCYEKTGKEKDACFRTISNEGNSAKDDYIVLLLYDLEEYVEEGLEDGTIGIGRAADLITEIVEIKIAVLNKASKSSIATQVANLRNKWPGGIK